MSLSTPFIERLGGDDAADDRRVGLAGSGRLPLSLRRSPRCPCVDFPTDFSGGVASRGQPRDDGVGGRHSSGRQFGRIAGVTEMTSTSYLGTASITMQFDLNRSIDAAARDVQAAINAAAGYLPANLPAKPTWRKVNPADAPIMILAVTSHTYGKPRMYDVASSVLQQKLSQLNGVGQVIVGGGCAAGRPHRHQSDAPELHGACGWKTFAPPWATSTSTGPRARSPTASAPWAWRPPTSCLRPSSTSR